MSKKDIGERTKSLWERVRLYKDDITVGNNEKITTTYFIKKFWERFQGKPFFKRVFLGRAKGAKDAVKALKGVGKTRVFPTFAFLSKAEKSKSAGKSAREAAITATGRFSRNLSHRREQNIKRNNAFGRNFLSAFNGKLVLILHNGFFYKLKRGQFSLSALFAF